MNEELFQRLCEDVHLIAEDVRERRAKEEAAEARKQKFYAEEKRAREQIYLERGYALKAERERWERSFWGRLVGWAREWIYE